MEKTYNVKIGDRRQVAVARDIVTYASEVGGSVYVEKDGRKVSALSLIGILSLCIADGDVVTVTCCGINEFAENLCLEKIGKIIC